MDAAAVRVRLLHRRRAAHRLHAGAAAAGARGLPRRAAAPGHGGRGLHARGGTALPSLRAHAQGGPRRAGAHDRRALLLARLPRAHGRRAPRHARAHVGHVEPHAVGARRGAVLVAVLLRGRAALGAHPAALRRALALDRRPAEPGRADDRPPVDRARARVRVAADRRVEGAHLALRPAHHLQHPRARRLHAHRLVARPARQAGRAAAARRDGARDRRARDARDLARRAEPALHARRHVARRARWRLRRDLLPRAPPGRRRHRRVCGHRRHRPVRALPQPRGRAVPPPLPHRPPGRRRARRRARQRRRRRRRRGRRARRARHARHVPHGWRSGRRSEAAESGAGRRLPV
mmetsp:Transcript_37706/g.95740  ORF Transcript_37706/g.95740 Transcript_37706/m.95740 type:complete len:349 (-) Transcript_37706:97-1143(-)